MSAEATVVREDIEAKKAADEKSKADVKAAQKLAADTAKREADERAATKAHLAEILLLRGLARAFSPHGSEDLAGALDGVANALASGRKLDEPVLVEVAIALKNKDRDFGAMVKKINELMKPEVLPDRTVVGILSAVQRGEVTAEQGQSLLQKVPANTPAPAPTPATSTGSLNT